MKVLLDENLDPRFGEQLEGHEVESVKTKDWRGLHNGELLRRANEEFSAIVTLDRGIAHQQNLVGLSLRILVLRAINNRYETVMPLAESVCRALESVQPGEVVEIGRSESESP